MTSSAEIPIDEPVEQKNSVMNPEELEASIQEAETLHTELQNRLATISAG